MATARASRGLERISVVDGPAVSTADGQRVVDGQSDLPFGFAAVQETVTRGVSGESAHSMSRGSRQPRTEGLRIRISVGSRILRLYHGDQ